MCNSEWVDLEHLEQNRQCDAISLSCVDNSDEKDAIAEDVLDENDTPTGVYI